MIKVKPLIISLLIALGTGFLSAIFTSGSMEIYAGLNKPPLAPPSTVFPIVWTVLFILMGLSSYLVYLSPDPDRGTALKIYAVQLVFNFAWPIAFFNFQAFLFAFIWIMILWVLIIYMIKEFMKVNKKAGYLQIPYLLWTTFAAYLNLFIWLMNR